MLVDHVPEHVAALLLVAFAGHAATAPGNLLPDQQPQLIAQIEHQRRLLIMAQAHKICAHFLDQP